MNELPNLTRGKNMKVSIVIPIGEKDRNQIPYLRKMLMNQSKKPDEILFITEGTIPEARNIGVKKARNEFILHCDAGTIYPYDYLEKMCKGFIKSDFISARFYMYGDKYQNFFIRNNFGSTRCIGYHKGIWEMVGGYDENLKWGEDSDFNDKALQFSKMYITKAICFWKARDNLKQLAKQFRNYGWGDKKRKKVKKLAYLFPILLFGEWIIHSFKLLRTIWCYRINYWKGIITK